MNMNVSQLKNILTALPDDMPVIIPVVAEDDCNHIFGFRHVRTAGILGCQYEDYPNKEVLCLNASADDLDIADQVHYSGRDVDVHKILFGESTEPNPLAL